MTVSNYDGVINKNRLALVTILVFFERSYILPHSCKVS